MIQTIVKKAAHSILVPVDFSAPSIEALLFAAQLAKRTSLPLVVLHVAHDGQQHPYNYSRKNEMEQVLPLEEIAQRMLHDFMVKIREQHPDNAVLANAVAVVFSGLPTARIPEIAGQIGASQIIMGSNSRTSLSKLINGSVAEKVARRSSIPVTIVPRNGKVRNYDRIVPGQINSPDLVRVSEKPV